MMGMQPNVLSKDMFYKIINEIKKESAELEGSLGLT
ncbi:hypothetical protein FRFR103141_01215 [Fructilactobacillus fructivorans]